MFADWPDLLAYLVFLGNLTQLLITLVNPVQASTAANAALFAPDNYVALLEQALV